MTGDAVWERRLRRALAGTSERAPRPLAALDLPLGAEKLLGSRLAGKLSEAAVLVPVMRRSRGLQVLFTRRAEHLRAHRGQVSFPGGRREASDASAAAAALREAEEEIGLPPDAVEICGYLDDYPTVTGFRVTPVVGLVAGVETLRPDPSEVAEVFEVPLAFLMQPQSFERKFLTRSGLRLPFFEINHEGRTIWGATAGMLWNLAQKLGVDREVPA